MPQGGAVFLNADWGEWRNFVTDELPEGMRLTRDQSGIEPLVHSGRAKFLTVSVPVYESENDPGEGLYLGVGFGRDSEMNDTNDKHMAMKLVAGVSTTITPGAVAFVEMQNIHGFDLKGVGEAEQQVKIGVSFKF
ncbi:MAG: hypothetical protein AAFV62_03190 [Pseudomonadota bacterium]